MSTKIISSLDYLKSNARKKVSAFLTIAKAEGLDVFVFESLRTQERQHYLFGKWRTKNTLVRYWVPIKYADPYAKTVTWTLNSKHLWGTAVDIVFDKDPDPKVEVPSWNWDYQALIQIGEFVGLRNLAPTELCHFEDDWNPFSPPINSMTKKEKTMLIDSLMNLNSIMYNNVEDKVIKELVASVNARFRELWFDNNK